MRSGPDLLALEVDQSDRIHRAGPGSQQNALVLRAFRIDDDTEVLVIELEDAGSE